MFDTESLIAAIEKRECLWLISSSDYLKREVKEDAWVQVAKDLFPNWEEKKNKEKILVDIKKKWTHIRDYYRRERKSLKDDKNGAPNVKRRKYVYGALLSFLNPIFEPISTESNYSSEQLGMEGNYSNELLSTEGNYSNEQLSEDNVEKQILQPEMPSDNFKKPMPKQKKRKKRFEHDVLNYLKKKEKRKYKNGDVSFLLSLAPEMKELTSLQKIEFKTEILNVLKIIKFGTSTQTQTPFYQYPSYNTNSSSVHGYANQTIIANPQPTNFNVNSLFKASSPSSRFVSNSPCSLSDPIPPAPDSLLLSSSSVSPSTQSSMFSLPPSLSSTSKIISSTASSSRTLK